MVLFEVDLFQGCPLGRHRCSGTEGGPWCVDIFMALSAALGPTYMGFHRRGWAARRWMIAQCRTPALGDDALEARPGSPHLAGLFRRYPSTSANPHESPRGAPSGQCRACCNLRPPAPARSWPAGPRPGAPRHHQQGVPPQITVPGILRRPRSIRPFSATSGWASPPPPPLGRGSARARAMTRRWRPGRSPGSARSQGMSGAGSHRRRARGAAGPARRGLEGA